MRANLIFTKVDLKENKKVFLKEVIFLNFLNNFKNKKELIK
jgi:hypothetical protein